jgi:hypothetical protein
MEAPIVVSFRNRLNWLDEVSERFLGLLVALGGYCTALQGQELIARSDGQARARLKALERLGFLRRITKYPVVFQVTKSTTRLLGQDSSSRRRHTLSVIQARLLGVHFYLEARAWPAEFVLDHAKKIKVFTDLAGCPLSILPQRSGKPYLREHFLLWLPGGWLAFAMIDQPQSGALAQLKVYIRQFLPLLRRLRGEPYLLVVTADKARCHLYEQLLRRHRAVHKLGLGELSRQIKPLSVKPPLPSIAELTWPRADKDDWTPETSQDFPTHSDGHKYERPIRELIED